MKPDKHIEQKLEQLADAIGRRDSFVETVMSRIENSSVQPSKKMQRNTVLRRIFMKSVSKFAAAAIVIVGISAVFLFNSSPGSIALADVYAKVQQATTIRYRTKMYIPRESDPR
ncbi:MAG: hypothetical protein ACYTEU_08240, partial [Planctomycetota bacterium]